MTFRRTAASAVALLAVMATAPAWAEKLSIGIASEATAVDPHFHNLTPNNMISAHVYDALIGQDEKQRLIPGLATAWKPIDDTTWEFTLREGVTFHDGSAFTADDVVCTWERAPNVPNSPSSFGTYTKGKTVEKIDDFTIHVKTEKPYPLVPNDISTIYIVSDEGGCEGTTEQFNDLSVARGTGPFMITAYEPGSVISLKRNDDYWGDKPQWSEVDLKPIKSAPSRVAALLSGDVDMIDGVPTTDIETLKNRDDLTLSQGSSNRVIYLHMDQFREDSPHITAKDGGKIKNPLMDQRVRLAISKAINRDAIVERVMEGVAIPAGQLLPDGFFGVSDNLEIEKYDPKTARALLAEAGYGDGFSMTIHGPNDRYINDAKILEAIGQMLSRIGIQTAVETMPRSVFFKRASRGGEGDLPEFSLVLVGWGAGSGEASSPLKSLIHTYDKDRGFGASNRGRHSDAAIDKMIEDALATVDDAMRQDLLAKATEMAMENLAIIPLHYQVNTWAAKKGITYPARTDEHTRAANVVKE